MTVFCMQPATARTPASARQNADRAKFSKLAPRAAQLHAPPLSFTQALTRRQNDRTTRPASGEGSAPAGDCLRGGPGTVWRDIRGRAAAGRADAAQRFSGPFGRAGRPARPAGARCRPARQAPRGARRIRLGRPDQADARRAFAEELRRLLRLRPREARRSAWRAASCGTELSPRFLRERPAFPLRGRLPAP